MLERTPAAGVQFAWVTGDCVYGNDRMLPQPQAYVLAVSGNESVWIGQHQRVIKAILADLPAAGGNAAVRAWGVTGRAGMLGSAST